MKHYEIKGTFTKKGDAHTFTSTVEAENEKMAQEKILSQMGSKQRLRRVYIKITSLTAAK